MAPGSVEGRFHQCMCLLRVVTEEAQTAKDTQLTADPIYVSVKLRRGEAYVHLPEHIYVSRGPRNQLCPFSYPRSSISGHKHALDAVLPAIWWNPCLPRR